LTGNSACRKNEGTKKQADVFAGGKVWLVSAGVALCLVAAIDSSADHRVALIPRLHAGQALHYQIHGRVQRGVTTQSRVTSMAKPTDLKENISSSCKSPLKKFACRTVGL
jgi:hypothetical protein